MTTPLLLRSVIFCTLYYDTCVLIDYIHLLVQSFCGTRFEVGLTGRRRFFRQRVVRVWNGIPSRVAEAGSFKTQLHKVLLGTR